MPQITYNSNEIVPGKRKPIQVMFNSRITDEIRRVGSGYLFHHFQHGNVTAPVASIDKCKSRISSWALDSYKFDTSKYVIFKPFK